MVSTDEPDALRIKHFEAQQQQKRLTRARASVDVVTQEEVLDGLNVSSVVLRLPEVAKKKEKVRELPMDIAKDLGRKKPSEPSASINCQSPGFSRLFLCFSFFAS